MKAEVIKRFKDAKTGDVRNVGEVFECSAARFKQINSAHDGIEFVKKHVENSDDDAN